VAAKTHNVADPLWAVVPLKSPETAKSRLSVGLDASARRRLVFAMARQVVRTLVQTPEIADVAVVTASPEVAASVEREGATVIWQGTDAGTAEACRCAVAHLSATAGSLLMISGDIPLICTEAVAAFAGLAQQAPLVAIVPDRRGQGTNALLCAPPALVPPCFGPHSFRRHLAAARERGVEVRVIESDVLSLDIDDLDDLRELQCRLNVNPGLLPAEVREAVPDKNEEVPAR